MMRALILLSLLLAGCVNNAPREPVTAIEAEVRGNLDPCIAYHGSIMCLDSEPEADKQAWMAQHCPPGVDEAEAEALPKLKVALVANTATTVTGLLFCQGAREANPLLSWLPPFGIAITQFAIYQYEKGVAQRSTICRSSAPEILLAAKIRKYTTLGEIGSLLFGC